MINSLDNLVLFCKKKKDIYIYGAGKWAGYLYSYLTTNNIVVKGFIISKESEGEKLFQGLSVNPVNKFKRSDDNYYIITAIIGASTDNELMNTIMDNQICNIYFLKNEILYQIWFELTKLIFKGSNLYKIEKARPAELHHTVFSILTDDGRQCSWRIHNNILPGKVNKIDDVFIVQSALDEFEKLYGKYNNLSKKYSVGSQTHTCNVYMALSHVDKKIDSIFYKPWVIPIQVGAALTDKRICKMADNSGDNISEKNTNYSECTALYWIWKNAEYSDYIGLCHYRRHFDIPDNDINILTESNIDVLTTIPTFVLENISLFLQNYIPKADIQVAMDMIKKVCPEYYETANLFFKSRFYPPCNLMVMKYNIFIQYCEFAFSVTFAIERFYEDRGIYRYNRYLGYIMECLLGIFLMKHKNKLEIAYTDMIFYQ